MHGPSAAQQGHVHFKVLINHYSSHLNSQSVEMSNPLEDHMIHSPPISIQFAMLLIQFLFGRMSMSLQAISNHRLPFHPSAWQISDLTMEWNPTATLFGIRKYSPHVIHTYILFI